MKILTLLILTGLTFGQTSFGTDIVSKYVWRGGTVVDGLSLQPSVDFGLSALNLNVWGSFGLSDRDVNKASDEIDYTATYGLDLKAIEANIGFIFYHLPNADDANTMEIFGDASFSLGPLGAFAAFYYDIDAVKDFYFNFGVDHSLGFADFSASLGYNNAASDISDINLGLERGFKLSSLEAAAYATFVLQPIIDDNVFFVGVHVSF